MCQAYDNEVAKSDKRHHRGFLNGIQCDMPCIDQWTLIIVANNVCFLFDSCMLSCLIKKGLMRHLVYPNSPGTKQTIKMGRFTS